MFSPSRDQARRFLTTSWAKYRAGAPLEGLERQAAAIITEHAEYHAVIEDPDRYVERDYLPGAGMVNPFLHLSLHLAIAEQLAIDQPTGIRACFDALRQARGDEHAALHDVLDCLAETLWQAQRQGTPPDATRYLECLARRCGEIGGGVSAADTAASP